MILHPFRPFLAILVSATLFTAGSIGAAEWQYSIPTGHRDGRVFLWIPPECRAVRGIVLGQQVILEKPALEDVRIREAAAKEDLAIALVVPACIGEYDEKGKGAETLQRLLDGLAAESGYDEIARAPLLTIGHSGGAIFAWNTAYWNSGRCFGVIGLKAAPIHPPAYAPKSNVDGVPLLDISGQYESWGDPERPADHHTRWVRGSLLEFRAIGKAALMSEVVEPGVTHFGWTDDLARYVALFIRKAAHHRIPAGAPKPGETPVLNRLPLESGWLTDCTLLAPPAHPAAPYAQYSGDRSLAFWHLDEELARANEALQAKDRGRALQMVTFVQNGAPVKSSWLEDLKFQPEGDGMTVRVAAEFVRETPPEMSFPTKRLLGHADSPIRFRLIGGWHGSGEQTGADTFRIKLDRFFFARPWGSLMIMAYHPGDDRYAYTEQPAGFKFPAKNTRGTPQKIDFPPVPDCAAGEGTTVPLHATADSGLPVEYCVIAGPAEIDGNALKLGAIPPRSRLPLKVTVTAYQWGRSLEPCVQTAEPVVRTFGVGKKP